METHQNKNLQGFKLLLVDDEQAVLFQLHNWLSESGVDIQLASGAYQAIEKLKDQSFDLIICDVRMPDGNASVLMSWLNTNPQVRPTVFLMSSHSEVQEYLVCKMGCDAFLLKPLCADVLLHEITRALNELQKQKAG